MADLEAVLADVSYLMAMEKSKCTPAARASKKIVLPDPRYVLRGRCPAYLPAMVRPGGRFSQFSTLSLFLYWVRRDLVTVYYDCSTCL